MKQKIKQFLNLTLGCLIFFFASCENDDLTTSSQSSSKYTVRRLKYADLQQNPQALQKLQKFSKKKESSNARNTYASDYGFSIDTDDFTYIGNEDIHSYTFRIEREEENEFVENLVLKHRRDGGYNAFLFKYDLSESDVALINSGQAIPDYASKVQVAYLPDFDGSIMNKGEGSVVTYISLVCTYTPVSSEYTEWYDAEGIGHWDLVTYYQIDCVWNISSSGGGSGSGDGGWGSPGGDPGSGLPGDGSSGGGGGTTNPGGTGSNPSDPSNPNNPQEPDIDLIDETNPVLTFPSLPTPIKHNGDLNKITNRPEVKARINQLRAEVTTVAMEQGSEFFTEETEAEPLFREDLQPKFDGIKFGPVYPNSILRVHSHHHPALEPVFSAQDVFGMARFFRDKKALQAEDAENITSILVSNLGIVALRVADPVKAKQFADKLVVKAFEKSVIKKYDKEVREKAYRDCNCTVPSTAYEQLLSNYLMDFLVSENTGLTLYSATINPDGSYTWSLLPKFN